MIWLLALFITILALSYHRAVMAVWMIALATFLLVYTRTEHPHLLVAMFLWAIFATIFCVFAIRAIRMQVLTKHILDFFQQHLPKMSITEKIALEAGTVGWEGELFSGKPDWSQLHHIPVLKLTEEEREFINGPVKQLCQMVNDWDITHVHADLPEPVWAFVKSQGFFGLVTPKEYGGKGFSAYAHSEILTVLAGCSVTLASTVAVPNSLGPAELLVKYGTQAQRDHYLPRLVRGEEIPCFALTGIRSGSDATTMSDVGVVCKQVIDGQEIVGIRLNWQKRYITLAPIATVIGLAFKLYDPDHLLGDTVDIGITCALIPATTPGVVHGRRHFPLNCVFQNGPTQGKDVFIPLNYIIGGQDMIGQGWRMLVECLSVGRAISLPANSVGAVKVATLATGAYARIREQFGMPIGHFEGIEERLARMGGLTYVMDATRVLTLAAIDAGEEPAIESAISKYHLTEMSRIIGNDAMDVLGGKGICLGPDNYIGRVYQAAPISITVEGANILTRSMIIFGQGAIRCHPYVLKEIQAASLADPKESLHAFDKVIFKHVSFIFSNLVRSLFLGLTNGYLQVAPQGSTRRYYQQLTRFSAAFAFLADVSMITFGSQLKRMEKISGRLADLLSYLFIGSALIRRFELAHQSADELPLFLWSSEYVLATIEKSLFDIVINFPNKWLGCILKWILLPLGRRHHGASDAQGAQVAKILLQPCEMRTRLCQGAYTGTRDGSDNPVEVLERALIAVVAISEIEQRIRTAIAKKQLSKYDDIRLLYAAALKQQIINEAEYQQLLSADDLRLQVIAVNDFAPEELRHQT